MSILNQIAGTVRRGVGIDPRLGAAILRAPAASKEDSRPQTILKFQPCNCFDYRVRYEPQIGPIENFPEASGVSFHSL